jgi:hypothetical protein
MTGHALAVENRPDVAIEIHLPLVSLPVQPERASAQHRGGKYRPHRQRRYS